jgi:hypothetical protein
MSGINSFLSAAYSDSGGGGGGGDDDDDGCGDLGVLCDDLITEMPLHFDDENDDTGFNLPTRVQFLHFLIFFDNRERRLVDRRRVPGGESQHPRVQVTG